jgi:endonuclease V-like protein UPF0215 family
MKPHVRVLGIDDSPFHFEDDRALVVGVVVRLPSYVEGVLRAWCEVDGTDANDVLTEMVIRSRFREQIKLAMVDGIALGGFNIVDISALHERTGVPFATITRDPPDVSGMENALRSHFPDWEKRIAMIRRHPLREVKTDYKSIHVAQVGIPAEEAEELIRGSTVKGVLPEPIRIAHLIATAMGTGESRGRA